MSDVVLRATNLGKSYTRYSKRRHLLMDRLSGQERRGELNWAVRGIDFVLRKGECLGIIGRNGAGKSTLLALLAGILRPTEGHVEATGKVLALLELGAGMDPDATGRQNARIHLMTHGLPLAQMEAKLREVEEFSDIGAAFDQAVRTYSSGMFLRVAFASNVVLEPDVLLVDEALAVGDVFFQQKCHARLREARARGTVLVIATHALPLVRELCDRCFVLDAGSVAFYGEAYEAVQRFAGPGLRPAAAIVPPADRARPTIPSVAGLEGANLLNLELLDETGRPTTRFLQGGWMTFRATYEVLEDVEVPFDGFEIEDAYALLVHSRNFLQHDGTSPHDIAAGSILVVEQSVQLLVARGEYTLAVGLASLAKSAADRAKTLGTDEALAAGRLLFRSPKMAFQVDAATDAPVPPFGGLVDLPGRVDIKVIRPDRVGARRAG